ncbi:hypothetical protein F53441_11273 [Fusarium austroafricanum]|uniref:Uncharacterized protein n=1 Tax=Fusarium austroafricanum TaxID=2364996 RepID=A0A8H4K710_9HYPO|nr:hypothetical protein F53441_11273 [Fusarium austroafricanum]
MASQSNKRGAGPHEDEAPSKRGPGRPKNSDHGSEFPEGSIQRRLARSLLNQNPVLTYKTKEAWVKATSHPMDSEVSSTGEDEEAIEREWQTLNAKPPRGFKSNQHNPFLNLFKVCMRLYQTTPVALFSPIFRLRYHSLSRRSNDNPWIYSNNFCNTLTSILVHPCWGTDRDWVIIALTWTVICRLDDRKPWIYESEGFNPEDCPVLKRVFRYIGKIEDGGQLSVSYHELHTIAREAVAEKGRGKPSDLSNLLYRIGELVPQERGPKPENNPESRVLHGATVYPVSGWDLKVVIKAIDSTAFSHCNLSVEDALKAWKLEFGNKETPTIHDLPWVFESSHKAVLRHMRANGLGSSFESRQEGQASSEPPHNEEEEEEGQASSDSSDRQEEDAASQVDPHLPRPTQSSSDEGRDTDAGNHGDELPPSLYPDEGGIDLGSTGDHAGLEADEDAEYMAGLRRRAPTPPATSQLGASRLRRSGLRFSGATHSANFSSPYESFGQLQSQTESRLEREIQLQGETIETLQRTAKALQGADQRQNQHIQALQRSEQIHVKAIKYLNGEITGLKTKVSLLQQQSSATQNTVASSQPSEPSQRTTLEPARLAVNNVADSRGPSNSSLEQDPASVPTREPESQPTQEEPSKAQGSTPEPASTSIESSHYKDKARNQELSHNATYEMTALRKRPSSVEEDWLMRQLWTGFKDIEYCIYAFPTNSYAIAIPARKPVIKTARHYPIAIPVRKPTIRTAQQLISTASYNALKKHRQSASPFDQPRQQISVKHIGQAHLSQHIAAAPWMNCEDFEVCDTVSAEHRSG